MISRCFPTMDLPGSRAVDAITANHGSGTLQISRTGLQTGGTQMRQTAGQGVVIHTDLL